VQEGEDVNLPARKRAGQDVQEKVDSLKHALRLQNFVGVSLNKVESMAEKISYRARLKRGGTNMTKSFPTAKEAAVWYDQNVRSICHILIYQ
jgi:hypothetical protein